METVFSEPEENDKSEDEGGKGGGQNGSNITSWEDLLNLPVAEPTQGQGNWGSNGPPKH